MLPIGPLEVAIVVVILLIFFGYRRLPALGRSAGRGVKQVKGSVEEMVGDKVNPSTLGKSAGKGVREAREFRDALTGKSPDKPAQEGDNGAGKPAAETGNGSSKRAPESDPAPPPDPPADRERPG
ncbi:MAG: hypothetical protein GEU88_16100 [Solirubrobacterales bacterium]|nr:hypothetical protein [Solirubrobacterales bacterium]